MGRGDPLPVAVSVRNFGNEARGEVPIRASWCSGNEGDKAGHCRNCNQEECEVFHKGSSIRPAFYSKIGSAGLIGPGIDSRCNQKAITLKIPQCEMGIFSVTPQHPGGSDLRFRRLVCAEEVAMHCER